MIRSSAAAGLALLALLAAPALASADDATTTTVEVLAPQPVHGQTAHLKATVADTPTPATVPAGAVQFELDGAALGTPVALSSAGTAEIDTSALAAGMHPVRAVYQPAAGFLGSDGTTTLTVGKAATTTLPRITPSTTGVAGQVLDVQVEVKPTTPPLGAPTGTVGFFVGSQKLAEDTLDADGIERGAAELPAVSVTITVTYSGDSRYAPSQGTTSVTVGKAGTVTALSASPNPAYVGQAVTFTMFSDSIAPSNWWPTGELTASVDGEPVPGSATLDGTGGGAAFTRSFAAAGTHRVAAHFAGDADFLASDAALDEVVNALPGSPATTTPVTPATPAAPVTAAAARGLTVKVAPKRDRSRPYRFTVSGSLSLPGGMSRADGCRGKVSVEARMKAKRVARRTASVSGACAYRTTITVPRKGSVAITARFAGTARVAAVAARAVTVRAG